MAGLAKPGKALSCMVAVIEGHELRLTVVQAILTGMALLRSQGQPTKFFQNTQEMSLWVKTSCSRWRPVLIERSSEPPRSSDAGCQRSVGWHPRCVTMTNASMWCVTKQ